MGAGVTNPNLRLVWGGSVRISNQGARVLTTVENANHLDQVGLGLVIVDDVLLHLDATTTREEIIVLPAKLGVVAQHV